MNFGARISLLFENFTGSAEATVAYVICALVFAVLYYFIMSFLIDNGASWLVMLFTFVILIGGAVFTLMEVPGVAFLFIPAIIVIIVFNLYSLEIKRLLWAYKNLKLVDMKHGGTRSYDEEKTEKCIAEIIKALQNMAKKNTGAIIILASGNLPEQIIDSGVKVESDISSELIESVFFPKTPLHDGAMIIDDTKIVAAGCFLPLSHNESIPKDLGTRHRAGIGVTENYDVVSLIVSEETGIISVAKGGKISRYADADILKKTLNKYYWQELESSRK